MRFFIVEMFCIGWRFFVKLLINDILYLVLFFWVLRYFFWWVSFIVILLNSWVEFFEILFVWFFYSISLMYLDGLLIKVFCFFVCFELRRVVIVGDECVICFLILISLFVVICDSYVMDVILFRFWYLNWCGWWYWGVFDNNIFFIKFVVEWVFVYFY